MALREIVTQIDRDYEQAPLELRRKYDQVFDSLNYKMAGMITGGLGGAGTACALMDMNDCDPLSGLVLFVSTAVGGYVGNKIGKFISDYKHRGEERK